LEGGSGVPPAAPPLPVAVGESLRWMSNTGRHQYQSILPWLWDLVSREELEAAPGEGGEGDGGMGGWGGGVQYGLCVGGRGGMKYGV
jgi:hypothetical protein